MNEMKSEGNIFRLVHTMASAVAGMAVVVLQMDSGRLLNVTETFHWKFLLITSFGWSDDQNALNRRSIQSR
jgi:hypothetical protein